MKLQPEQLAEAVTCLRRDVRDRMNTERRVLPRFRVWAPLPLRPVTPVAGAGAATTGEPFTVWLRDLSRGGLGLMYTRRLEPEAQFLVELPRFEGDPRRLLCAVVYCAGAAPDMFSIGARFVAPWDAPPPAPAE